MKYDGVPIYFGTDKELLPLWVADTDFTAPEEVLEAIKERADHPIMGYTLREDKFYDSIVDWCSRRYSWSIEKSWISTSPGVVAALSVSILAYTKPADRVVINTPVYPPFYTTIEGLGREIVKNPLTIKDGRYRFDLDHLSQVFDGSVKMFILCNPHNPGGMAWSREELEALGNLCVERGVTIVSDEIHSDLLFDNKRHISMGSISESISKSTVVAMAPSKSFNIAGLSSSFVVISDKLKRAQYNKMLQAVHIHGGNIFGNLATAAAYTYGEEWLDQLLPYLEANRDYALEFIEEKLPKAVVMKAEATYLLWIDLSAYGKESAIQKLLVEEGRVALNFGSMFGEEGEGFFRLNFGTTRSKLEDGLSRVEKALKLAIAE